MSRRAVIETLADLNSAEDLWRMVGYTVRMRKSPVVRRAYRRMLGNYLGALELRAHRAARAARSVERIMGGVQDAANDECRPMAGRHTSGAGAETED